MCMKCIIRVRAGAPLSLGLNKKRTKFLTKIPYLEYQLNTYTMQKLLTLLASVSVMGILTIGFSSCKDDEDPPAKAILEFSSATKTVSEGEDNVKANIVLDKPAPADVIVSYSLEGNATRKLGSVPGDYEIVGTAGEVEIAKGESTGEIVLNILEDTSLELDEKIVITIDDVSSSQVEIGTDDQMEITITGGGNVTASFAAAALTVNEGDDGIHELVVNLNAAAAFDVTVEYTIKSFLDANGDFVPGTAIDSLIGTTEEYPSEYWDYYVDSETVGELVIPAGETSGIIGINVYSDFIWEDDDKIELTLTASTGVTVGATPTMTVTIEQEDGKIVELDWTNGASTAADMDLFLWVTVPDNEGNPVQVPFASAVNPSDEGPETRIIPNAFSNGLLTELGETTLEYGASYVYWGGTQTPLQFTVTLGNLVAGVPSEIDTYNGTYTLANINEWDNQTTGTDPIIVQTFEYTGGNLANISDITIPTTGSRVRSAEIKPMLKRSHAPFAIRKLR